jgi:hypothetical protein
MVFPSAKPLNRPGFVGGSPRTFPVMQVSLYFVLHYVDALPIKFAKQLVCSRATSFGGAFQVRDCCARIVRWDEKPCHV